MPVMRDGTPRAEALVHPLYTTSVDYRTTATSWGPLEPWGPPVVQLHGLRPDPANPRRISDEELDALERRVITKATTGWTKPELAEPRVSGTVVVCPEW